MSHDEQADRLDPGPGPGRLARWLEQPPDASPEELEPDVLEAVIALRPERAPALQLTADDILESVTRGPLAGDPGASGTGGGAEPSTPGEVLPFPSRPRPETAPAPALGGGPRRWLAWAGGTSSIGLALVAAAALFLVLPQSSPPTFDAARQEEAGRSSASAPSPAEEAPPQEMVNAPPPPAAAPSPDAQTRTSADAPARTRVAASTPATPAPAPIEMSDGALYKSNTLIPELDDAVALAEEDEPASEILARTPVGLPASDAALPLAGPASGGSLGGLSAGPEGAAQAKEERSEADTRKQDSDLSGTRSRAVPRDLQAAGWRKGVDRPTLEVFDAALAEAQVLRSAGNRRAAADRLVPLVGAPARAGQHVASLAAADYLAVGDAGAALSVAATGLGLSSSNTPERSQLLVVYGDALTASGNPPGAVDAWGQAEQGNAAR